jgi:hypothetical protein
MPKQRLQTHKEIAELVEVIDTEGTGLDNWEIGFISGLIDNPPNHYSKQCRVIINRLYEEKV